jgi:hypothetical protein
VKVYKFSPAESAQIKEQVKFMTTDYLKKTDAKKLPGKEFLADLATLKAKYEKEYGK